MPVKARKDLDVKHVLITGGLDDLNEQVKRILEMGYSLMETKYLNGDLVNRIFVVFYIFVRDMAKKELEEA